MKTREEFYTYIDYRLDTGEPFYVGKGLMGRVRDKRLDRRNKIHSSIVKKHGIRREIALGPVTNEEALSEEVRLISELKTHVTQGGANLTLGGEGFVGKVWSDEEKQRVSKEWTEERRMKASQRMKENNPMKNKEISGPVVESLTKYHTGRKRPPEEIEKCRLAKLGSKNPAYGKPQPEEAKRKNAEANRIRALARWERKRKEKEMLRENADEPNIPD